MQRLGTKYGGWILPKHFTMKETDSALCIGVGEDMSFDLLLSNNTNCNVFCIDPTKRAKKHWDEIKKYYEQKDNYTFTGNIQNDYNHIIQSLTPNLQKMKFVEKGVNDTPGNLKFYKQSNPNYVSQSLEPSMFTSSYDVVPVDTIENIVKQHSIQNIELIKMDIEGSEVKVLHNMIDTNILPKYLLVEFDLYLKHKDPKGTKTAAVIKRLLQFYTMFHNDNYNITFIRKN